MRRPLPVPLPDPTVILGRDRLPASLLVAVTVVTVAFFAPETVESSQLLSPLELFLDNRISTRTKRLVIYLLRYGIVYGIVAAVTLSYLALAWPGTESVGEWLNIRRLSLWDVVVLVGGFFATGVLFAGFVVLSALLGIGPASHSSLVGEPPTWRLLARILVVVVLIAPVEELLFRRVAQDRLRRATGPILAIGLSSLVFALTHAYEAYTGPGTLAALALSFAISAFWGTLYELTDNLLVAILAHGLWDGVLVLIYLLTR